MSELLKLIKNVYQLESISEETILKYENNFNKKNLLIQTLFAEAKDGRIIIDLDKVPLFKKSMDYGLSYNIHEMAETWLTLFAEEEADIAEKLLSGFTEVLESSFLSYETSKIEKNPYFNSISGIKVQKLLNTLLDLNILKSITDKNNGIVKSTISKIRNNIIGGKISSLFSLSNGGLSLVLSINQVDFFLMSDGSSWGSCMSPGNDYSSGTLTYGSGPDTILTFLVNTSDLKNPDFSFSDREKRIWRQTVFITEDSDLILSKAYPSKRDATSFYIADYISEKLSLGLKISKDSNCNTEISRVNSPVSYGYVDILSGLRNIHYAFRKVSSDTIRINLQDCEGCISCGDNSLFLADSHTVCDDCYYSYLGGCQCEGCGTSFHEEDLIYVDSEDAYLCEDCVSENYIWSDFDCKYISVDDAVEVLMFVLKNGLYLSEIISFEENSSSITSSVDEVILDRYGNQYFEYEYVLTDLLNENEDGSYSLD